MERVHTVGLDTSRSLFQVHAASESGEVILRRRYTKKEMANFFKRLPVCLIGMEATGGSNYLAQRLAALGHTVKLMPPSYVKPYVKTNKNDVNDAEAICEAVRRPNMRFVPIKYPDQQAILLLHRTRSHLMRHRVSLTNAIKAALVEFGVAAGRNSSGTKAAIGIIDDPSNSGLPHLARISLGLLVKQLKDTEAQILECANLLDGICNRNPLCMRLMGVPGIGILAATALVAAIGDGTVFRSGREMAAWLGLVPRQNSSGGRQSLGGISKRGDTYLRRLLVIGAMALMRAGKNSKHPIVLWAVRLAARKHYKLAAVALANKIARIAWAVLAKGQPYRECPQ